MPPDLLGAVLTLLQFQPEGDLFNVLIEPLTHLICDFGGSEDNTDFGIVLLKNTSVKMLIMSRYVLVPCHISSGM